MRMSYYYSWNYYSTSVASQQSQGKHQYVPSGTILFESQRLLNAPRLDEHLLLGNLSEDFLCCISKCRRHRRCGAVQRNGCRAQWRLVWTSASSIEFFPSMDFSVSSSSRVTSVTTAPSDAGLPRGCTWIGLLGSELSRAVR